MAAKLICWRSRLTAVWRLAGINPCPITTSGHGDPEAPASLSQCDIWRRRTVMLVTHHWLDVSDNTRQNPPNAARSH